MGEGLEEGAGASISLEGIRATLHSSNRVSDAYETDIIPPYSSRQQFGVEVKFFKDECNYSEEKANKRPSRTAIFSVKAAQK